MNDPNTFIEPLGGYLVDLLSKLRGRPFVPHSLTKLHNIVTCRNLTRAKTIIEIGAFKGVTTRRLSYFFDNVISIEIDADLFDQARKRCAGRSNVKVILGDGSILLPEIIKNADNALLFLDGHFSGGVTGQGEEPEPVLKELDLLKCHLSNVAGVVVDDFRLFGLEPGWPKKSEVLRKLEGAFDETNWSIFVQFDQFLVVRRNAG